MSINNSDISNQKREFSNDFSIDRSNFIINSCKNNNNYHKKMKVNENPFKSMEPLMFEKKFNNQFDENKKLVNSLSMVDIKPSFTNSKKNYNFNINNFKPDPNIEEIPTFSYENDLNVKSFRYFMNKKNEILEKNYANYVRYMRKFDHKNKKNQLISPYSLYIQKLNEVNNYGEQNLPSPRKREIDNLKQAINRYENPNDITNQINYSTNLNLNNNSPKNRMNNFNMNTYLEEVTKNREKLKEEEKQKEKDKEKDKGKEFNIQMQDNNKNNINTTKSVKDIKYFPKNNEISNPELFYKKGNIEYYKYRKEQKKFDDYNYNIILNHNKNRFIKKEPDVNPFNPRINLYKIGNSSLAHNIILRPGDFYGYLKQSY